MIELIQEVLREITGKPLLFAVEFVQFLLLVAVVRFLLPRIVGRGLKERRERIAAEVQKADLADAAYAEAERQAAALIAEARAEARRGIEAARAAAQEERRTGLEQAEQEAKAILLQAQQTVETDKARVTGEASERLVTLITQVTRRFIEESLTESERRAVTEKLILASLKEMEDAASRHRPTGNSLS
jgi:F0F1-type ATP synthase membrane subunit b/b'